MPQIIKYSDRAGIREKTIIQINEGVSIGEALKSNFEPAFAGVPTDLHLNHIGPYPLGLDGHSIQLTGSDTVYVLHRQQGGVVEDILDPFGLISKTLDFLIPLPSVPNNDDPEGKSSPNSSISAQTNVARPYQAIPDLLGEGKAFPDLLQPAVYRYENNRKVVREVFCLGLGSYTELGTFSGETATGQLLETTVTKYEPGFTPSDLQVARETVDVDNDELIAQDDKRRQSTARGVFIQQAASVAETITIDGSGLTGLITFSGHQSSRVLDLQASDAITITGTVSNDGPYTVSAVSYNSGLNETTVNVSVAMITEAAVAATIGKAATPLDRVIYWFDTGIEDNLSVAPASSIDISSTASNDGTFTVTTIASDVDLQYGECKKITVPEAVVNEDDSSAILLITGTPLVPWVGWFQMQGQANAIRIYWVMPRGIRGSENNQISVEVEAEIEETDINGTPIGGSAYTVSYTFSGNTLNGQFVSIDQATTLGYYRIRSRRVTSAYIDAADLVQWEQAVTLLDYDGSEFGDITVYDLETRASGAGLNQSNRKFNVDYIRKLPDWTPGGGYDPSLTDATSGFRAALYQHVVAAGRPLSQIDIEGLYDIYSGLSDPQLGLFNYSFDDEDVSHGERMKVILDASRVATYRDGQVWRFVRDEPKSSHVAEFNRRNISSGSSQDQGIEFQSPKSFDSVEVRYTSPDTNKRSIIQRRIDAGTQSIINNEVGARPRIINLSGCRNLLQATDRANLEVRRIIYQRRSVSEEVLSDGNLVDVGDRVRWADIYDGEIYDGEILDFNGIDKFTTSEKLDLSSGSYVGLITNADGEALDPVPVTQISDFEFSASFPESPIVADGFTIQAGSKFLIGKSNDLGFYDFTVTAKAPQANGRVKLELINYDDRLYELDGVL